MLGWDLSTWVKVEVKNHLAEEQEGRTNRHQDQGRLRGQQESCGPQVGR